MNLIGQRLENLQCDERDLLDKSGPKIARHKPISDLLTPTELKPYIPYRSSEDLVYKGTRKCCEFSDKGHIKNTYSSTVSLLRPFSESETGSLSGKTCQMIRRLNLLVLNSKDMPLFGGNNYKTIESVREKIRSTLWIK